MEPLVLRDGIIIGALLFIFDIYFPLFNSTIEFLIGL